MFDSGAATFQRQCQFRGSKKFKRYSPLAEREINQPAAASPMGERFKASAALRRIETPEAQVERELSRQDDEETMAKLGDILLKSAANAAEEERREESAQQLYNNNNNNKTTNYHFLACYEDSSFLYHRNRPSEPASDCGSLSQQLAYTKSSSNTTADSMLTPSSFASSGAGATSSSVSSTSTTSEELAELQCHSPDSLQSFAGARRRPGLKRRSPDSSLESSGDDESLLPPPLASPVKLSRAACALPMARASLTRGASNYFEDERVFTNLILKERAELGRRQQARTVASARLAGELRHSLLAWMLRVCEHQSCQDEIFPLATQILEKFLRLNPIGGALMAGEQRDQQTTSTSATCGFDLETNLNSVDLNQSGGGGGGLKSGAAGEPDERLAQFECAGEEANELLRRQLCLFAACALLLATKLRQTPRLCVQTLVDFSRLELPLELTREEILDGEILLLSALKWDLAALVTPNDFLQILARKCQPILAKFLHHPNQLGAGAPATLAAQQLEANNDECQQQQQQQQQRQRRQRREPRRRRQNKRDEQQQRQLKQQDKLINRCGDDESRVRRHTQTLLELCLMDAHISQHPASVLAMAAMAVAIDGLSRLDKTCWRLREIVTQIHESTDKVNELKHMIEVAFQIEKYVQKLLHNSAHDD